MIVSDKIAVQEIISFAKANDIKDVIISPGSRNAPFTISFTHDPFFNCHSVVDERSAAFIGLGMTQAINKPVILVCTSGSAALNYSPAIVEAYNQGLPLLIITADRPSNGYRIGDGQCFNQTSIYHNYIKYDEHILECEDEKSINDKLKNAFNLLFSSPFGPVHVNVSFSEPLYNTFEKHTQELVDYKIIQHKEVETGLADTLVDKWKSYQRKLILVFQGVNASIGKTLEELMQRDSSVYVLSETLANLSSQSINTSIDRTIEGIETRIKDVRPDLIVTIGKNIISKKIKHLFRKYKPQAHWSFSNPLKQDYFIIKADHFNFEPHELFNHLPVNETSDFQEKWNQLNKQRKEAHKVFLARAPFSDLLVFNEFNKLFLRENIQLGNSSVIRYVQLFDQQSTCKHFSNRGVSGIDGCTSTAIGFAHKNKGQTIFITGDLSFFYDGNAFWNNLDVNLSIYVINNGGGSIFGIIDGPSKYEKSLPFFKTPHQYSIKTFCKLNKLSYSYVKDLESLRSDIKEAKKGIHVTEVDTSEVNNEEVLHSYFKNLNINQLKPMSC